MADADLPLFAWQPPRRVILFPIVKRTGYVRDVAIKLLNKPTERSAAQYRKQATEALVRNLQQRGVDGAELDGQLAEFWQAVEQQIIRITYAGSGTGGAA